jgi:hypothetical protein
MKKPSHIAYVVTESENDDDKAFWASVNALASKWIRQTRQSY